MVQPHSLQSGRDRTRNRPLIPSPYRAWPCQLLLLLLALSVVVLACATPSRPATPTAEPLRILLTNDDGVDASGLRALRTGLLEAGHEVLTVAPRENRSGNSGLITVRGILSIERRADDVYAVDGSPVDCVRIGLGLLSGTPPDIVVSGINFGQNVGPGILMSGTVGAAIAAASLGYPAIAVSQMFARDDASSTPRYFDSAAETVVTLLATLSAAGQLDPATLLNVNHPPVDLTNLAGWRVTRPARDMRAAFDYSWNESSDAVQVSIRVVHERVFDEGTDEAALEAGAVSITPLRPSFAADVRPWRVLEQSFDARRQRTEDAP